MSDRAGIVEVVMGAYNLTIAEPEQVIMTSTEFIVHENYRPITIQNDVSVIKLPSRVTFNGKMMANSSGQDNVDDSV